MNFKPSAWCVLLAVLAFFPSFTTQATQLFLSEIKMPPETENIHVHKLGETEHASDFVVFIKNKVPAHKHLTHTETVYVLEGTGVFIMNDEKVKIGPGHYVKIPPGAVHSVEVTSKIPLKVLSVQAPQFFGKDRVWVK